VLLLLPLSLVLSWRQKQQRPLQQFDGMMQQARLLPLLSCHLQAGAAAQLLQPQLCSLMFS
jgi:hypothetical protein